VTWLVLNFIWPPPGLREIDEEDAFGIQLDKDEEGRRVSQIAQEEKESPEIVIT
jgi:NCS1 family nucleobase:cation symporter-1